MKVTLTSKNHGQKHSFNLVVRDQEIVLTTPDGEEFAAQDHIIHINWEKRAFVVSQTARSRVPNV